MSLFLFTLLTIAVNDRSPDDLPPDTKPSTIEEYEQSDSIDPASKGPAPTDTDGTAGGASGKVTAEDRKVGAKQRKSTKPSSKHLPAR